ncbi:RNA recognition motif domain protein [Kalmanozyma brasiliensis GHG001]|uniref:RNA recognition motif domain protein n=1 Tax=Kalmanozyma brasiliensis (strain GHG001) TaxID=1365824 RepID=UPI001CEA6320|nr:RNA recognition motif domain protein [Kalmanozyma brasiliensis GHG001]EST09323.2 RNA recognition motif domain protein [Kalmanozyma brasiliensis GHG001]
MAAKRTLLRLQLVPGHGAGSLLTRSFATTASASSNKWKFDEDKAPPFRSQPSSSDSSPSSSRGRPSSSKVTDDRFESTSRSRSSPVSTSDDRFDPSSRSRPSYPSATNGRFESSSRSRPFPSARPNDSFESAPSQPDSALGRTVFVRTKSGKNLVSVVHTLSLLSQLAAKFGPIQHFHFPREPSSQRLLGYGSVTFFDKDGLNKALSNDGVHTVTLPPLVPSRAPRTYLSDKEHARLVGMDPLISCEAPSQQAKASHTFFSSRSLQNPASMRPGWNDVAALCNMEGATQTRHFVDESQATNETPQDAIIAHDSPFYLSTSPVSIEVKMERRTSSVTTRPGARAEGRLRGNPQSISLHTKVRAALKQFGGFSNVIEDQGLLSKPLDYPNQDGDGTDSRFVGRDRAKRELAKMQPRKTRRGQHWLTNRVDPRGRRHFSTSAIVPDVEQVKAKRKAEWQRNRHSNFVDQLYLRLTGGKGGDGCVSFHREKFVQFGPPSGGNGGSGGSIYIRAVEGPTTLARISRRFRGADGPHGQGSYLHGKKAEDKYVEVPVGTVVTATRRLRIPEEEEAEEYYQDLLKRAAKAKWDPTGIVAKEDVVLAAEEAERKRLIRSRPSPDYHRDEGLVPAEEASEAESQTAAKVEEAEEDEIDGEDLLDADTARQLQSIRDRVWRHYPRAEETNYRRNEFRAAEMRLAIDRRRRRRYLAQSQAGQHASLTAASSSDQASAASCTPYEDDSSSEAELWSIDLDEPTPADSPGILLASGGRGGLGNPTFLSTNNRSPKFATRGEWGESLEISLELKRPSDIGLVGLPNAGKSTILRSISASKAQVGHWRFTTLSPNLGVVRLGSEGNVIGVDSAEVQEGYGSDSVVGEEEGEEFRLVLSDIPGLIDGASDNRGLGHTFLRHIERCALLAYVLDLTEQEPWKDLQVLHNELASYREDLPAKARLVIVNKADQFVSPEEIEEAKRKLERIKRQVVEIAEDQEAIGGRGEAMKVLTLSAKKKQGTQGLAKTLVELLRAQRAAESESLGDKFE